ncbi:MAG: diguanylate cyclase [Moraxellaceae bacterium]
MSALSDSSLLAIRQLLAEHTLWPRLPAAVAERYTAHRLEQFRWLAQEGWPLLPLAQAVITAVGWLFFSDSLVGPDRAHWLLAQGLIGLLIILGIVLVRHPRLQAHYQRIITVMGAVTLGVALLVSLVLESARLMQANSYVCLLIITILVLALRLSLLHAAVAGAAGIAGAMLAAPLVFGVWPDWSMLLWFSSGSLLINLFVGAVLERYERIAFLQSLLLAHESAERERLNAILARHASEDPLTGLANRRQLSEALWREWERAGRNGLSIGLLFVDVDHFKPYNDHYGHHAGDEALVAVARALQEALLRPADLVARYGGEEFVVLLPETDSEGAVEVAQRLLAAVDALALPHAPAGGHLGISIGIATACPGGDGPQALLDAADAALYEAKAAGRPGFRVAAGARAMLV